MLSIENASLESLLRSRDEIELQWASVSDAEEELELRAKCLALRVLASLMCRLGEDKVLAAIITYSTELLRSRTELGISGVTDIPSTLNDMNIVSFANEVSTILAHNEISFGHLPPPPPDSFHPNLTVDTISYHPQHRPRQSGQTRFVRSRIGTPNVRTGIYSTEEKPWVSQLRKSAIKANHDISVKRTPNNQLEPYLTRQSPSSVGSAPCSYGHKRQVSQVEMRRRRAKAYGNFCSDQFKLRNTPK